MKKKYKILLKNIAYGLLDAALIALLYVYILPYLFSAISQQLESAQQIGPSLTHYYIAIALISGLAISSRFFRGTIFRPVLLASANLLGALYSFSYLNKGVISAGPISSGDYNISFQLNITPLIIVFFMFFVVPSVVLPFVDYFIFENR